MCKGNQKNTNHKSSAVKIFSQKNGGSFHNAAVSLIFKTIHYIIRKNY